MLEVAGVERNFLRSIEERENVINEYENILEKENIDIIDKLEKNKIPIIKAGDENNLGKGSMEEIFDVY